MTLGAVVCLTRGGRSRLGFGDRRGVFQPKCSVKLILELILNLFCLTRCGGSKLGFGDPRAVFQPKRFCEILFRMDSV